MDNFDVALEPVDLKENEKVVVDVKEEKPESCLGIASMVFGILGLLAHFIPVFPLCAYFPFIGVFLALGDKLKNKNMTANAKIGLILSIITYALSVLSTLIATLLVVLYFVAYFMFYFIVIIVNIAMF